MALLSKQQEIIHQRDALQAEKDTRSEVFRTLTGERDRAQAELTERAEENMVQHNIFETVRAEFTTFSRGAFLTPSTFRGRVRTARKLNRCVMIRRGWNTVWKR